jgi:hypothetical protein
MATHGSVHDDNCHPFVVGQQGWLAAHNGIIHQYGDLSRNVSDTRDYLTQRVSEQRIMADLDGIAKEIGLGNKIAFLSPYDGSIKIANESVGHWLDGVWYSNYSYDSTRNFCGFGQTGKRVKSVYHYSSLEDQLADTETIFWEGELLESNTTKHNQTKNEKKI